MTDNATQIAIPLRPMFNENAGPVVLCHRCVRERVQFDWRVTEQLCEDCREPTRPEAA